MRSILTTRPQVEQRLVELDRATSPAHGLAAKLARYARLYRHTDTSATEPLWRSRYETFPQILVVLTGTSSQALDSRRQTVLALCQHNTLLTATPQVRIAFCLLDELTDRGPFAPIFLTLHDPEHWTDWLGRTQRTTDRRQRGWSAARRPQDMGARPGAGRTHPPCAARAVRAI